MTGGLSERAALCVPPRTSSSGLPSSLGCALGDRQGGMASGVTRPPQAFSDVSLRPPHPPPPHVETGGG